MIKKKLLKTAIMLSLLSMGGIHTSYAAEYTDTILNESKNFKDGDIVNGKSDGTAIKANNGKETNISVDGTMTLQGMPLVSSNTGVVLAQNNSTLNFNGDKFIINNLTKPNLYGWGSFGINADKKSNINFSSNVDIHSQNCGISIRDYSTFNFKSNNNKDNKLNIYLTSDPKANQASEMKGILLQGTLNVDSDTSIIIKANEQTQSSKLSGISASNNNTDNSNLNFNKNLDIDMSNGISAEGITLSLGTSDKTIFTTANFKQNTNINLHNNKKTNIGLKIANNVHANFNNININIDGGLGNKKSTYNNAGILMQGGNNLTINGTSNISVKNNQKSNHGIFLTQSTFNDYSPSNMVIGDTNIITANGESSIGIEIVNSNLISKDGHKIFINSSNGSKNNCGLYVKNGHFEADTVNIDASGNYATGIFIGKNNKNQKHDNTDNTTNIKNLTLNISGNKGEASGILTEGKNNKLIVDNATIKVNSTTNEDNTYGIIADSDTSIDINNCTIDAKNALTARKYAFGSNAGNLTIKKDFISNHNDSIINANRGAAISINTSKTGTVKFSGISKLDNNKQKPSTITMNLSNKDSYWHITGDSNITNLKNDNALIDMTYDKHKFSKLNIKNLSGNNGIIHMDIDASKNLENSDKIYISGTHIGENFITLNNLASSNENAQGSILISVNDEQGKFLAKDGEGSLYWKKYTLSSKESSTQGYTTDWFLAKVENIPEISPNPQKPQENHGYTTSVNTILNTNALGYYTWINENDTLWQRLDDLRNNGEKNQGIWFRTNSTKLSGKDKYDFTNKFTAYHLGYDFLAQKTANKVKYQGIAFSYTNGESSYLKGNGDNQSKSISLYNTELYTNGSYFDLILKASDIDNDFSVFDSYGKNIIGKADNKAISLSAEYGYKYDLAHDWFIEPQAQMTLGYYDCDDYHTNNDIWVKQNNINSIIGRLGFNIGRKINDNGIFYLKANLLHEFAGNFDITMHDQYDVLCKKGDFSQTWFEYGFGIAMATSENSNIYLDVERSTSGDFNKNWQWNAGMRWNF